VIGGVLADLQRRSARQEPDEDLPRPVHASRERDRFQVRRNRGRFLEPAEIGQAVDPGDGVSLRWRGRPARDEESGARDQRE
jgi:hypothetical protein